jgi:hypothetical protein
VKIASLDSRRSTARISAKIQYGFFLFWQIFRA